MFKVYKKAIDPKLISKILKAHEEFKKSPSSIFRAQGTNAFEKPIIDEFKNQVNSIHNPHLLGFSRKFRKNIEEIIFNIKVSGCLSEFTGQKDHVHYQSMFFDKSTGTKLHQDTWYLDTYPKGNLVGMWIALEDITFEAGPFCLYDAEIKVPLDSEKYNFNDLEKDKLFQKDFPNAKRFDFLAKKGDILIWDSFAIHGSLKPKYPYLTRKSITAHYYPLGQNIQNESLKRLISIYNHRNLKKTKNKNLYKAATINPYIYSTIIFILRTFKPLKIFLMRDKKFLKIKGDLAEIRRIKK